MLLWKLLEKSFHRHYAGVRVKTTSHGGKLSGGDMGRINAHRELTRENVAREKTTNNRGRRKGKKRSGGSSTNGTAHVPDVVASGRGRKARKVSYNIGRGSAHFLIFL
jgi:hypothetical protein